MLTIETLNPYQFNFSLHRMQAETNYSIFVTLLNGLLHLNQLKQHNFSSHQHSTFLVVLMTETAQVTSDWTEKSL